VRVEVNGIELAYDILGQTGHPLVLIHGFGLDHTIWMDMASNYLHNHRVILPDVRGHGDSDAPPGVYEMSLLAKDIAHLLEYLGINKATICGHSMGGYITLAFAEKYPERLAGMGLITSRSNADSEENREGRYKMMESVQKRGAVALGKSLSPRLTTNETLIQEAYNLIAQTPPMGIIGVLKGMAERPDRTSLLSRIAVPTLVVAGEDDQIIDLGEAREMVHVLPRCKFLAISGVGHMPMWEAPAILAKGLDDLVERVRSTY